MGALSSFGVPSPNHKLPKSQTQNYFEDRADSEQEIKDEDVHHKEEWDHQEGQGAF